MVGKIRPERWKQAEALFGEALERPLEARVAFLDRSCGSDRVLRRQVERLLVADCEAQRFLARPALEEIERPTPRDAAARPRSIGPYRLIREIGEGGMSTVWLAVRDDRELRRRVAIKCLRYSVATEDLRRRIRRERQILASLSHPNIARLYDVGTTADGLPYFVMEYIEGSQITDYCDQRRLTIEERLELFRAVCSAVHYAHQNLIVHRDIKPGNILVTETGTPKLLDFGVAKWLNPELTSRHLIATLPWQQFLTPDYASPEQILGKPVTTVSDVYSLGVLLFELLTGRRPYPAGRSPQEIERMLAEGISVSPSAALGDAPDPSISLARGVEPQQLRRRLAGDLDNVVAKALRQEPQRRYGSAEQLAEDLRRHLVGLPVAARRPTFRYRAGRFLHRNRVTVGVAAAFAALLVGATIALSALSLRLAHERDAAYREREKATRVASFLQEIFELTGPDAAKQSTTTRELLDRASQRLEELEDQPELQAELMGTVGGVYSKLGLYAEARRLVESALEIQRRIFEPPQAELADTLSTLAMIHLLNGEPARAEAILREVLAMRQTMHRGDEHPSVATVMRQLGLVLEERGRYQEAEELCRQALAIHRRLLEASAPELAESMQSLGVVLSSRAKYAEAEPLLREALERRRTLLGDDHLAVAESMNDLAVLLKATGAYEESERLLNRSLEIHRQRLGEQHYDVLANLSNLASLATTRKDYAKAEALYREALERARSVFGAEHRNLAYLLLGLGICETRLGDPQGAEGLLREALEIRRKVYGRDHYLTAKVEVFLGTSLTSLGRFDEAEALLKAAYRVIAAQEPPRERERDGTAGYLAELYRAWGRPEEAAEYEAMLSPPPTPKPSRN